jgi:membrane associated rhomboid family serine protease
VSPLEPEASVDRRYDGFKVVAALAVVMWVVEVINSVDHYDLNQFGIEPRKLEGLDGVLFAPFLHGSWGHLIGNTIPFVIMGCAVALKGAGRVLAVTAIVGLVSGLGTWLISPDHSITVGASGIVFGYATYLLLQGFFDREVVGILIGVVVVALWGTALLSSLAPHPGVSWQGHVFGAIGGAVAAELLRRDRRNKAAARPAEI